MSKKYPPTKRKDPLFDREFKVGKKRYHIFADACIKSNIWEYNVDGERWFMQLPPDATLPDRIEFVSELLHRPAQLEWHRAHEGEHLFRCTAEDWERRTAKIGRKPTASEAARLKCQG